MKKILVTVLCLAAVFCGRLSAQVSQYSVDLAQFSDIDVSGPFEVSIVRGSQYRALITVLDPYKEYVVCNVGAGKLTLTLDERKVPAEVKRQFRGKGTPDPVFKAIVYVPELLQSVKLSGKAVMQDTEDLFDKARITFVLEDNASVRALYLSSLVFKLDMKGKSSAEFVVTSRETVVNLAGTANLKLEDESEDCIYTLVGSSKARVKSNTRSLTLSAKSNSSMTLVGSGDGATFELAGTSEVDASQFELSDADVRMSSVTRLSVAVDNVLRVNLNGGSTLLFSGDPSVSIDNIRSATMTRLQTKGGSTKL